MKKIDVFSELRFLSYKDTVARERIVTKAINKKKINNTSLRIKVGGNCNVDFIKPSLNLFFGMQKKKIQVESLQYNNWQSEALKSETKADWWIIWLSSMGISEGGLNRKKFDYKYTVNAINNIINNGQNALVILPEILSAENNPYSPFANWRKNIVSKIAKDISKYAITFSPENIINSKNNLKWFAPRYWTTAKIPCHPDSVTRVGFEISNIISIAIKNEVKAIAFDLDDTIWGGIIGDLGYENIELDPNGLGRGYLEMQRFLKDQSQLGIPLFAVSKNNFISVNNAFRKRKEMILKKKDILGMHISWDPKHLAIKKIANQLNIALENICFIDDSVFEREQMKKFIPEMIVFDVDEDAEKRVPSLIATGLFNIAKSNHEDRKRVKMFRQDIKRSKSKDKFTDIDNYLNSLKMKLDIFPISKNNIQRVNSLIEKTNQFNFTYNRTKSSDILSLLKKNNHYLFCGSLRDKYGESGIIYVIIASVSKSSLIIKDWVMSCRVFGRGVEEAAFNHLSKWVKKKKIDKIEVKFKKTEKNKYLQDSIKNFSFKENKTNILSLDTKNIKKFKTQIQINEIKTY